MVLFENINVNQHVEVLREDTGNISTGTVRYKGCINGVRGEWVGVELDFSDGDHDGMLNARRYFPCRPNHGIFTTASQIRFIPLLRRLRNPYRTTSRNSEIDVDLLSPGQRQLLMKSTEIGRTESLIDNEYRARMSSAKFDNRIVDEFAYRRYPLCHTVGGRLPTASMLRGNTAEKSKFFGSRSASPDRVVIGTDYSDFISPPAIPKSHMPHSALKRYVSGGLGMHWPRQMTVNTGRDSIKLAQWNDISA